MGMANLSLEWSARRIRPLLLFLCARHGIELARCPAFAEAMAWQEILMPGFGGAKG
jgi:hypothetical protein